ncbi:MAG: PadR family transcriptional regulator [Candidatus Methanosuratus sp.]|nr:PadR family transcriptional regulator [Candidatus Methanosuratincola sp.]
MRGMLSFQILWLLSKRSMNGQQICNEIGLRRGKAPTPGTIYPALKELRKRGLVRMRRSGRETRYSLSERGKEELEKACRYFISAFGDILHEYWEVLDKNGRTLVLRRDSESRPDGRTPA